MLDTARGQGFVQFAMIAPSTPVALNVTQPGQLTGPGTGNPSTTGQIAVAAAAAVPLVGLAVGAPVALLAALGGAAVFARRRRRRAA